MSYYSISAILTSAQKVPCTFDLPIPNLGFLDDNPGGDVRPPSCLPRPNVISDHQSHPPPSPPLSFPFPTPPRNYIPSIHQGTRKTNDKKFLIDRRPHPTAPPPLPRRTPRRPATRQQTAPHARPAILPAAPGAERVESGRQECGSKGAGGLFFRGGGAGVGVAGGGGGGGWIV